MVRRHPSMAAEIASPSAMLVTNRRCRCAPRRAPILAIVHHEGLYSRNIKTVRQSAMARCQPNIEIQDYDCGCLRRKVIKITVSSIAWPPCRSTAAHNNAQIGPLFHLFVAGYTAKGMGILALEEDDHRQEKRAWSVTSPHLLIMKMPTMSWFGLTGWKRRSSNTSRQRTLRTHKSLGEPIIIPPVAAVIRNAVKMAAASSSHVPSRRQKCHMKKSTR